MLQRLAREVKIWADLVHDNVLSLIGFYVSEDMVTTMLLSPHMSNGDIRDYLERANPGDLDRLRLVRCVDDLDVSHL